MNGVLRFMGLILITAGAAMAGEDGLVGFWRLDDGKGDVVRDSSGNDRAGKAQHCAWDKTNGGGAALEFLGYQSFVDVPWHKDFYPEEELTLAVWVHLTDLTGEGALVSMGREHPSSGYHLIYDNGALLFMLATERRPRVGGRALHRIRSAKPLLEEGRWAHVAATYSVSANKAVLYFNGASAAEAPADGKIVYYPVWGMKEMPLTFGDRSHQKYFWSLDGFLRNVRLYGRALKPDEIKRIYESEREEILALRPTPSRKRPARELPVSLHVDIADAESGERLPAKVLVTARDGRSFWPEGGLAYGFMEKQQAFFTDGKFSVRVPAGEIEVHVQHGFEYLPAKRAVSVGEGEQRQLRIELKPLVKMKALGWYGGEHHLHPWGHGKQKYDRFFRDPKRSVQLAALIFKAEGLDYAFMAQLEPALKYGQTYGEPGFFLHASGEDFTGGTGGDMCFINTKTRPRRKNIFDNISGFDHARKEGGVALHTHPYWGEVGNPKDLGFARDLPVAVALEKESVWDLFCWGGTIERKVADWYRFLNLGFRLGVTGSTDTYLNNPRRIIAPGCSRTYVRASEFSIDAITDGYRYGRTFATKGPLVVMQVNGKDIGDVIKLNGPAPVEVEIHIRAWHLNGLERVEVIRNGTVVKSFPGQGRKAMEERFRVPVAATSWLVAHCAGKSGGGVGGIAYTSPIYLQFGSDPIEPKEDDIAYFLQWLDDYERVLPAVAMELGGVTQKDYAPLLDLIEKARRVFRSLPEKPKTWLQP